MDTEYFSEEGVEQFEKVAKRAAKKGVSLKSLKKGSGEKVIVKDILKFLNNLFKCKARKVHGSIYSAGEPDIDCCYNGRTVKIECKDVGKKVDEDGNQAKSLKEWSDAGALSFWTTSLFHVHEVFLENNFYANEKDLDFAIKYIEKKRKRIKKINGISS